MSGGGRYGETRVRDAGPERKVRPGVHNRKARRAAKARLPSKAESAYEKARLEAEKLNAMWEAFGRAQRARTRREFDPVEYDEEHGYGLEWPAHIPERKVVRRILRLGPVFERMSAAAFRAHSEALVELLAFDGSEHLVCDTGKLNRNEQRQKDHAVNQFARALALCSCGPEGVKYCGYWFHTKDGETRVSVLVPKEDPGV